MWLPVSGRCSEGVGDTAVVRLGEMRVHTHSRGVGSIRSSEAVGLRTPVPGWLLAGGLSQFTTTELLATWQLASFRAQE